MLLSLTTPKSQGLSEQPLLSPSCHSQRWVAGSPPFRGLRSLHGPYLVTLPSFRRTEEHERKEASHPYPPNHWVPLSPAVRSRNHVTDFFVLDFHLAKGPAGLLDMRASLCHTLFHKVSTQASNACSMHSSNDRWSLHSCPAPRPKKPGQST